MQYACSVCGYIYDEGREGIPFVDLAPAWRCPVCNAAKAAFFPEEKPVETPTPPAVPTPAQAKAEWSLSTGGLAVPCSNLTQCCEKQYQAEEAPRRRGPGGPSAPSRAGTPPVRRRAVRYR